MVRADPPPPQLWSKTIFLHTKKIWTLPLEKELFSQLQFNFEIQMLLLLLGSVLKSCILSKKG